VADDTLEDPVRRLTALVIKIEERDTHVLAMLDELREFTREQREFNREQIRINTRFESLMTEVFRERQNGRDA
jgi:hypothetical protein